MINYALICENDHEFDSWFDSMAAYDKLARAKQLTCPVCGTSKVSKAIMAPNISTARQKSKTPPAPSDTKAVAAPSGGDGGAAMEAMAKLKDMVEQNFDDVGSEFPEEARKIHHGEVEERGIYGDATLEETKELIEEGINVMPVPWSKRSDA